jgi:hypothetical protein
MALLNAIVLACAEIAPSRALALLRQTEKEYLAGRAGTKKRPDATRTSRTTDESRAGGSEPVYPIR